MKVKSLVTGATLIASLVVGGCAQSDDVAQPVAGDLSLIEAQSGARYDYVIVGEVVVEAPGSGVWDEPDGVAIGRIQEGNYPVYASDDGWLQVALVEEKSGPTFGWVPASSVKFIVGS